MKKQYKSPSMKAYTVKTTAILAGSDGSTQSITGGGSNKDKGINAAEAKSNSYDWDEEW